MAGDRHCALFGDGFADAFAVRSRVVYVYFVDVEFRQFQTEFRPERRHLLSQIIRHLIEICCNLFEADTILYHELYDCRFGLGCKLAARLLGHVLLSEQMAGADEIYQKFLGIRDFQAILARSEKRNLGVVIDIMDRQAGYAPVNVEHLDFVDIPYFGRERILAAERQPEKAAENRQILGVECVFAGPELAHQLSLGEQHGFLRLRDEQLRVGAQIGLGKAVGVDGRASLRLPSH